MRLRFTNCLLACLVIAINTRTTFARSFSYLDELIDEDVKNQDIENNIDSANLLRNNPTRLENSVEYKKYNNKNTRIRSKGPRKYVNINLDGSHNGLILNRGESREILCSVNSNPQARVYWVRGYAPQARIEALLKNSVLTGNGELDESSYANVAAKYVINCANYEDVGPLHCVAISGDQISFETTNIMINENGSDPPCPTNKKPVITNHAKLVLAVINSTVVLSCQAEGIPRPETSWYNLNTNTTIKDNPLNTHYTILEDGSLKINGIDFLTDMGGYVCMARSSYGTARAETFLYPMALNNPRRDDDKPRYRARNQ